MVNPKTKANKVYKWITYAIISILLLALLVEFLNQRWTLFFVTLLTLFLVSLPILFQKRFQIQLPPELTIAIIIFISASIYLGEIHDFYEKFWWWDTLLHTFSGFILGIVGFGFFYILYQNGDLNTNPFLVTFLAFCFAMTIGVIWEIFEFSMDQFFGLNMQRRETGVVDTMLDFIANTIGASIACIGGYFYLKKKSGYIYSKLLGYFEENNPKLFKR